MRRQAATTAPAKAPHIAAVLDLEDPAERRIVDILRNYFGEPKVYRLRAIRRGTRLVDGAEQRTVWTLCQFQPQRRRAKSEWSVIPGILMRSRFALDRTRLS